MSSASTAAAEGLTDKAISEVLLSSAELVRRYAEINAFYRSRLRLIEHTSRDGFSIIAAVLPQRAPRARLAIIPGRGETPHKYAELLFSLNALNIAAAILFVRGQGLSERLLPDPQKCHLTDFPALREDLTGLLDALKLKPGGYGLLGFSLGGLLTLDLLASQAASPARACVVAPYLWPHHHLPAKLLYTLVRAAGTVPALAQRYVPGGGPYKRIPFEENHHSHDAVRYKLYHDYYAAHPKITLGAATLGFVSCCARRQSELTHGKFSFKVPLLALLCGDDRVVSNSAARHFFAAHQGDALPPLVEEYPGAYHDALNEADAIRNPLLSRALSFALGGSQL